MGWGPRGDSGSARSRVRATQPTQKNLPVVNSGNGNASNLKQGAAASRVQSESSGLAWASVLGEARIQKVP